MAQRTTVAAVRGILGRDYDTVANPSLQPYIDTATKIVDRVVTCASAKGTAITAGEAELIERWLAAHYYTISDPIYMSKSTGGASGSFPARSYKDVAIELDYSGCLKAILTRAVAGAVWLGKVPSEQIDADDRD